MQWTHRNGISHINVNIRTGAAKTLLAKFLAIYYYIPAVPRQSKVAQPMLLGRTIHTGNCICLLAEILLDLQVVASNIGDHPHPAYTCRLHAFFKQQGRKFSQLKATRESFLYKDPYFGLTTL